MYNLFAEGQTEDKQKRYLLNIWGVSLAGPLTPQTWGELNSPQDWGAGGLKGWRNCRPPAY